MEERGGYTPCESESKTKNEEGIWTILFLLKLVPSTQAPPLVKGKKENPKQEMHFLNTNMDQSTNPSPLTFFCFCAVTAPVSAASGTPGASALIKKGNRIVFCLFSCYVVLKCISCLCITNKKFFKIILHCSHFLEPTIETLSTLSYTAPLVRTHSTFVWPGRAPNLCCCRI